MRAGFAPSRSRTHRKRIVSAPRWRTACRALARRSQKMPLIGLAAGDRAKTSENSYPSALPSGLLALSWPKSRNGQAERVGYGKADRAG
jgi:hypothetical protein